MTTYRRDRIQGGCYFFTVNLLDRRSDLLTRHIDELRSAYRQMAKKHLVQLDAMVIMPDHLHAIWTLPEGDDNYSIRWQLFKALFSKTIPKDLQPERSESRINKRELAVWQRRFWEHRIRDELDYQRHMDYIHYNPVKHGYVSRVQDWQYSTFQRCVQAGIYPLAWGGDGVVDMDVE